MFIGDVRQIEDLAEGETATPEPDMGYELRTANGDRFERGTVEHLVRRGDMIVARTTPGDASPLTPDVGHGRAFSRQWAKHSAVCDRPTRGVCRGRFPPRKNIRFLLECFANFA